MKNVEVALKYDGEEFTGVRELGFSEFGTFVVSLFKTPREDGVNRGSFMTTIPISLNCQSKKRAQVTEKGVKIWDDWGTSHLIDGPNVIIDELCSELIAVGMMPIRG